MESKGNEGPVLAAITTAIESYLSLEQEAHPPAVLPAPPVSLWSQFGRQELMKQRIWCQLRMLRH